MTWICCLHNCLLFVFVLVYEIHTMNACAVCVRVVGSCSNGWKGSVYKRRLSTNIVLLLGLNNGHMRAVGGNSVNDTKLL